MRHRAVATSILLLVVFFVSVPQVSADEERNSYRFSESRESREENRSPRPFMLKVDRLKDARLKYCEVHHGEITTRSESLSKLVAGILGKFDAIVTRVQEYYTSKVVPSGKTVANYDALIADITAKKAQVQTDLANALSDVSGFSCDGDNPKGQITDYRTDMQLVKKDLQNYRTSIKNLLVAVKSVVGESDRKSPKPSASPI